MQLPFSVDRSQRWFRHRSFYRPSQEPLKPSEYDVQWIEPALAKSFVVAHHYSASFPYSMENFGLFRRTSSFERERLVGVATFSTGTNPASITKWCGLPYEQGVELGRFVLLDECPGNSETWFLARALRGLKAKRPAVKCVLSYSDPHPRTTITGEVVFPGHAGVIYSSANAFFLGRASPRTLWLNHDGQVLANRLLSKVRNGERGAAGAERQLAEFTGLAREDVETAGAYIERALASLRTERHPGNFLFLFPLAADRREKQAIVNLPVLRSHVLPIAAHPKFPDPLAV